MFFKNILTSLFSKRQKDLQVKDIKHALSLTYDEQIKDMIWDILAPNRGWMHTRELRDELCKQCLKLRINVPSYPMVWQMCLELREQGIICMKRNKKLVQICTDMNPFYNKKIRNEKY